MKIEFFPRQPKPKPTLEEKVARLIPSLAGGSYIILGLFFLTIFGAAQVVSEPSQIADSFILKVFAITILYIISLFLVATLPGKSSSRRRISWLYSILFHGGLLIYLGAAQNMGAAVLAIGLFEVIALLLSVIGISLLLYSEHSATSHRSR